MSKGSLRRDSAIPMLFESNYATSFGKPVDVPASVHAGTADCAGGVPRGVRSARRARRAVVLSEEGPMIAGLATHASLAEKDPARPFVYTDESFNGVRRELTYAERLAVEDYASVYHRYLHRAPAGLHYMRADSGELLAVYFPLTGADLEG